MVKHNVELLPFPVPEQVTALMVPVPRSFGIKEPPKFLLSELDEATLSELCNDFIRSVFNKAGKEDPHERQASAD